jgi:hypothetical protein
VYIERLSFDLNACGRCRSAVYLLCLRRAAGWYIESVISQIWKGGNLEQHQISETLAESGVLTPSGCERCCMRDEFKS